MDERHNTMKEPTDADNARVDYRGEYRRQFIRPGYRGLNHLALIVAICVSVCVFSVLSLREVGPLEWLAVPLTFLYANLAEYLGHRFVMHRRRPLLGLVYERHTRQHHRFFTDQAMQMEGLNDLRAILFPPVLLIFFFAAFALPAGLLLAWLFSANVAWLFVMTAIAYYLSYELLHLSYHLPLTSRVLKIPGMMRLRELHLSHHDPKVMSHANFNITWPICDWLFRTRVKAEHQL